LRTHRLIGEFALAVLLSNLGCESSGGLPPPTTATAPPAAAPAPPPAPPPDKKALFDRLGGQPAVEAVVDEFLKRVAADKRINARFGNTDLPRLRNLLVEFVCFATGGPCQYTGRDMKTAHAGMQLVEEEFAALVENLVGALDKFNVPKAEKDELLGALGPLGKEIVDPPPAEAAAHDAALATKASAKVDELRKGNTNEAADLLEMAIAARLRGQRSYAEQLYSSAERLVPQGSFTPLDPLFRAGAPERITTALKTMPKDTAPQPKESAGGTEDEAPKVVKPKNGSLSGVMQIEAGTGGAPVLGVIALEPATGKWKKRTAKQRIMEQRERQFAPRLLAISAGSTVSFPNFDGVFHNVFSISYAKAFDLGTYRNGETREVRFEKEGLIRLGCNLHANMSAHLVVVAAPHYVVTDGTGKFNFRSLAPGKYKLRAWTEATAEPVTQTVEIVSGENKVNVRVPRGSGSSGPGADKFGLPRGKAP
jgi:hemoglobin